MHEAAICLCSDKKNVFKISNIFHKAAIDKLVVSLTSAI